MIQFADEEKAERRLAQLRRKEADDAAQARAAATGISYVDLSSAPVEIDAIKTVPEDEARAAGIAVFQIAGRRLKIAVENPERADTAALLRRLAEARYICEQYLASRYGLERAWSFYKKVPAEHAASAGAIALSPEKLAHIRSGISSLGDIRSRVSEIFHSRASEALEVILAGALATGASDVHLEPQKETVRLRLRLDGVLHDVAGLPHKLFLLLLSRIKLISELKLNIHDRAQDGRFTIQSDAGAVEVRASVLPGPDGENIVLRILNPEAIRITFRDLGMQPRIADAMERELKKPNGLILTTGPTGSGKTTTLYTFLGAVRSPEIKIITIEDPIEYHLAGVEQTQVDQEKGYDFSNGLRAIVRQDPDVILVGEIRDLETAETAMHASLTGHLVFSTLHTNDAAGTMPRLIDLGVRPAIIAPAINVAMAQRLVRKVCSACRSPKTLAPEEYYAVKKELADFPAGIPIPEESGWTVYAPPTSAPCPVCGGVGYRGRIGVYEIILIDDQLEQLILQSAPEREIKKAASAQGQITMRQDGLLKILAGVTDAAEIARVVG